MVAITSTCIHGLSADRRWHSIERTPECPYCAAKERGEPVHAPGEQLRAACGARSTMRLPLTIAAPPHLQFVTCAACRALVETSTPMTQEKPMTAAQQHQEKTTALAPRGMSAPMPFEPENIDQLERMAERLAKSTLLPPALRNKPADVFLTLMVGRELGLSTTTAIREVHIVEGKPTLAADLIVALVKRHPDCVFFKLVKSTDEEATYKTDRRGEGETEISYTMAQATKAGLAEKQNWKRYPAAMLRARAATALARAVYPEAAMGLYDPDELDRGRPANDEYLEHEVTGRRVLTKEEEREGIQKLKEQLALVDAILKRTAKAKDLAELERVYERAQEAAGTTESWQSVLVPAFEARHAKLEASVSPEKCTEHQPHPTRGPCTFPKGHPGVPSYDVQVEQVNHASGEPVREPEQPTRTAFEVIMETFDQAEANGDLKLVTAAGQAMRAERKAQRLTGDEVKQLTARGEVLKKKMAAK